MKFVYRVLAVVVTVVLISLHSAPGQTQGNLFEQGTAVLRGILGTEPGKAGLTDGEIRDGLREALRIGTERVTVVLGRVDGFNADPDVHIPLPGTLQTVQSVLSRVGLAGLANDLELRLNRAAEAAAPHAKELFWQAISEMSLQDARGILNGPNDAATRFFQSKMTAPLTARFTPIVNNELAKAGAIRAYDRLIGDYKTIPFVPDAQADLTPYVVEKALDGLFLFLAREEAAIRQNPVKRTTELLRKVFGA